MLKGYGYCRHYYNKIKGEVETKKEYKRNKFYTKWECNIKRLKGLNLKVLLDLKKLDLGPYNSDFVN